MDAELEKIIQDGKKRYKAFENADIALNAFKALEQAKSDFTKTVDGLTKERVALEAENEKLKDKKKEADEKAFLIISHAEAKARDILAAADEAAKDIKTKADKKLAEVNGRIASAEAAEKYALEAAKAAQAKLDAIQEELDKTTARFKTLVA